jgi:hypothetical protein
MQTENNDQAAQIVAHFVRLIHNWKRGDKREVSKESSELERFGVRVHLPKKIKQRAAQ